MGRLPEGCAENAVVADQGGVGLLIRPSVAAPMEIDVAQRQVSNEATKPTHRAVVEVAIVLVGSRDDHVKVTSKEPGPCGHATQVLQLGKEGNLLVVALGAINTCYPPGGATRR